jgi:small ligand-binding sensory domain FIST
MIFVVLSFVCCDGGTVVQNIVLLCHDMHGGGGVPYHTIRRSNYSRQRLPHLTQKELDGASMTDEASFSLFRDGSGELLLSVVSFLNVRDGARLARSCRRGYFWVSSYRRLRGPEFVAAAPSSSAGTIRGSALQPLSNEDLVEEALAKIQAPPRLCLAFETTRNQGFTSALANKLPPSTITLGVQSPAIQSVLGGIPECDSSASLFLGTLPESAEAQPFCWERDRYDDMDIGEWTTDRFLNGLPRPHPTYWKVMMVYSTHMASGHVEEFIQATQNEFPHLQIVGGICGAGFVSHANAPEDIDWNAMSSHEIVEFMQTGMGLPAPTATNHATLVQQIKDQVDKRPYHLRLMEETAAAIFGVILGGDVPVETVVSRGVQSSVTNGPPCPTSDYVVQEAVYHTPGDEAYMFSGQAPGDLPPYHMLRAVRNVQTGETLSISTWLGRSNGFDLVGLRRPDQDGFCLHPPHPLSRGVGGLLFFQDTTLPATAMDGYEIDLYSLDGRACRQDVHDTLQALRQEVSGKKLLGGCMFSCAARGPSAGMLGERMADAAAWADKFPQVPLLGWYAGGEIGPLAMAGRKHALRGGDTAQRASLQGFTAVFALWIVPVVDWTTVHLDDATEAVANFCKEHLLGSKR